MIEILLTLLDALMDALTLRTWSASRGSKIIPFKVIKTK